METPVWTFLGPRPANWWIRRRLHEAAVHRADAAIALGSDFTLAPDVAADGITEWLERVAIQAGSDGAPLPLEDGNTLHLHATDPGLGEAGEWTIAVAEGRIAWSHEHGKGTVALRGGATELLLAIAAPSAGRRHRYRGVRRRRRVADTGWTARLSSRGAHGNLQTMTTSEIATVLAWHDALNASDLDTLVALSSDDIEIGDAHGAAQGHEALRRWAALAPGDRRAGPDVRARRRRGRRTKDQQPGRPRCRHDRRVGVPGGPRPRHLGVPAPGLGVGAGGHRTDRSRPRD